MKENDYVEGFFHQQHATLRHQLYQEMKRRWKENDSSLPMQVGPYWYYTRDVPGAEYPVYCRRPYSAGSGGANTVNARFLEDLSALWHSQPMAAIPFYDDEEIYLDPNLLQRELRVESLELGDMEVSPDHSKLALMVDLTDGSEVYTLLVMELSGTNFQPSLRQNLLSWSSSVEQKVSKAASVYELLDSLVAPHSPSSPVREKKQAFGSTTRKVMASKQPPQHSDRPIVRPPSHQVLHRISEVDMGSEVMWGSPSAVLYFGIDEAMRPYQLIYHDLTNAVPESDSKMKEGVSKSEDGAMVICYEENDDAFWMGSLCTTADHSYFMFQTSSSDASEWHFAPMMKAAAPSPAVAWGYVSPDTEMELRGAPLHPLDEDATPGATTLLCVRKRSVFSRDGYHVEYDLDHHPHLFGPSDGGWVIRSNMNGNANFAVWCTPSNPAAHSSEAKESGPSAEHLFSDAVLLMAHNHLIKIEEVELSRDYLLIHIRRRGVATVLFCPLSTLWKWWQKARQTPTTASHNCDHTSATLQADDLVDLSSVMAVVRPQLWEEGVGGGPIEGKNVMLSVEEAFQLAPVEQKGVPAAGALQAKSTEQPFGFSEGISTSPLPFSLECFCGSTDFSCRRFFVGLSHYLYPQEIYSMVYDAPSQQLHVQYVRREEVKGEAGYDASAYTGLVVWVPSDYYPTAAVAQEREAPQQQHRHMEVLPTQNPAEVERIPVYVLWRLDAYEGGVNPLILHVYGSYGDSCDVEFSSERMSLLDRGFMWANAAVRGGGDFGVLWRDAGRKLQRGTTVNDFLSVAKYLQDGHICAEGKLISCGGSAGGFVVCRGMTAAPHLFHAVIAAAPFVDCLATLLRPQLPLTVSEWEEFGNPIEDPEAYRLLRCLSPVDSLPPQGSAASLPHIFLETSWNDSRVNYWESLKLVALMRRWAESAKETTPVASSSLFLHHCNFKSGHSGSAGRYEQLKEIALEYAFALLIVSSPDYFRHHTTTASTTHTPFHVRRINEQ